MREAPAGFEPTTFRLLGERTANYAIEPYACHPFLFLFYTHHGTIYMLASSSSLEWRLSLVAEHLSRKQKVKGSIPLIAFFSFFPFTYSTTHLF